MTGAWRHMVLGLAALLVLGGCAARPGGLTLAPDMERVWPVPPDAPRIAYLHQIRVPEDAGVREGAWRRLVSLVAGRREPPRIEQPVSVYADAEGRLLVTDIGLQVVHVFNTRQGTYAQAFRLPGGRLASPVGVAFDPARRWIFVADSILNHVYVYDTDGIYVGVFGEGLKRVAGLAWDVPRQRLFAADTGNHRVVVFDANGAMTGEIGKRGEGPGEFNYPTHVAVNGAGELLVTDSLNFRVQVFGADGAYRAELGGLGQVLGRFSKPKGVAVDEGGRVFVVDGIYDVVQLFDADGRLLMHFGGSGSGPGQFWLPAGIAVTGNDIYVADTRNGRVQIFRLLNTEMPPADQPAGG
ncbi:MAG: 6-bladed beta-propeller [Nitrospirae bacterium]|nr:6-bladed beta-propeller [Nitrospirota bacterium]